MVIYTYSCPNPSLRLEMQEETPPFPQATETQLLPNPLAAFETGGRTLSLTSASSPSWPSSSIPPPRDLQTLQLTRADAFPHLPLPHLSFPQESFQWFPEEPCIFLCLCLTGEKIKEELYNLSLDLYKCTSLPSIILQGGAKERPRNALVTEWTLCLRQWESGCLNKRTPPHSPPHPYCVALRPSFKILNSILK